jgi:hypothetical protein
MPRAGTIRIISTPGGEAPPNVRSEWVGLTLPINDLRAVKTETIGIVSGELKPPMTGYPVEGRCAVDILASKSPWAAEWWREEAPHVLEEGYLLVFPAEVCRVL